jgi:hypothetical protein
MQKFLTPVVAIAVLGQMMVLSGVPPAAALSVDLAKKCRDLAIKSHPPPIPPGNKAYAQAEREFFRDCVAKNGQMSDDGAQQGQPNPANH